LVTVEQKVLKVIEAVQPPEDFVRVLDVVDVGLEKIPVVLNVALVEGQILSVVLTVTGCGFE
jgi:hypothetical protein